MARPNSPTRLDKQSCLLTYQELAESLFDPAKAPPTGSSRKHHARLFHFLECFIDQLLLDDEVPFVPRIGRGSGQEFDFTRLADHYFRMVPEFINIVEMLSPMYDYSEHLNVFAASCQAIGLLGNQLDWHCIWRSPSQVYPHLDGMSAAELFNALVAKLRLECRSQRTKDKVRQRRKEANERFAEYCRYIDALFEDCARLVVLRIDLNYKKEYWDRISAHDAVADLDHLLDNHRCNSLFSHRKGYIAKLEYGFEKGLHFHLVFFFDGSRRDGSKDIHFAQRIGEYWANVITRGRGEYWNCNAHRREYENKSICGIGVINAHQVALRDNLKERVVRYLCKSSQFIRPKLGPDIRLIRRGNLPKKRPVKLGRPRVLRDSHQTPPSCSIATAASPVRFSGPSPENE